MARLVLLFAVIGILPGLVIYLVSVQFVSRSIESWFDVRVEVGAGIRPEPGPHRARLLAARPERTRRAAIGAGTGRPCRTPPRSPQLSRLRDQTGMQEATDRHRQRPGGRQRRRPAGDADAGTADRRDAAPGAADARLRGDRRQRRHGGAKRRRQSIGGGRHSAPARGGGDPELRQCAVAAQRCALPAADAGGADAAGDQRRGAAPGLQRIPAALGGALGPAQDVSGDADADPAAGDLRRHRQRLPDRQRPGQAAAAAGRRHQGGGRGQPVAAPDRQPARTSSAR